MKKSARAGIIVLVLFILASVTIYLLIRPFVVNLRVSEHRERFSAWVEGLGFKGVAILLGIQVLQIVLAFIPGGPVELVAGAAYGAWGGFAICILGCVIATTAIFFAVRTFGAPLVKWFSGKELTGKYAFLRNTKKLSLALFILYLVPGVPKDALTYIVPLGTIKLRRFLIISTGARVPAIFASTMLGSSMLRGHWALMLALFAATAVMGIVGVLYGERIVDRFRHRKNASDSSNDTNMNMNT
jgi:uncharacterized membrane protein YdjX (TVP38/TMEM64 family)